jgi:hypothetical protein
MRPARFALALALPLSLTALNVGAAGAQQLTHTFHSAPSLRPPLVWFSGHNPDPGAGDIFLDAQNSVQAGPMVLDPQGQLIWFEPLSGNGVARDVAVQRYHGQSVLTYWQGFGRAFGVGRDVVLDHSYKTIATVQGGNGFTADTHAFQITPQDTALVAVYRAQPADLSSVGGPRQGTIVNAGVQEIDIATGQVLWHWNALGHLHLTDGYMGKPGKAPYDAFHLNSVQQLPNGDVLVSVRNMWAVYEVNKRTGRIVWTLGGKHSSFKLGQGANFEWQHDAAMQPDGSITLFDDGAALTDNGLIKNESQSRALRIHLDLKRRQATLLRAYTNHPALLSQSQGSMQLLADGNAFVGWGSEPYATEFGPSGAQLFSAHFPTPLQSYRAYRAPWSGQPTAPPSVAASATSQGTQVYASWNGATEVGSWQVLVGASPSGPLTPAGTFAKTFFETAMWVQSVQPYVAVQALDRAGRALGISAVVPR